MEVAEGRIAAPLAVLHAGPAQLGELEAAQFGA
jgi:hypothetical protein